MKLEDEIIEALAENREIGRGFIFMIEKPGEITLKGSFSDIDALNFVSAIAQERPAIMKEVIRNLQQKVNHDQNNR